MAPPVKELPARQRAPKTAQQPPQASAFAEDGAQLQVRISELEVAVNISDSDLLELSQGGYSRRLSVQQLKATTLPDLTPFLTGIVGGDGIQVLGAAPVVTVELDDAGSAGTYGDAGHIPEITTDQYGRVIGVNLIPVAQPDISGLAPIDSPAFTGVPTAPTPPPGNASDRLATTQFVGQEFSARALAPLASPAFSGTPTAPTPPPGDNDTSIATTEFVEARVAGIVPPDLTGYAPIDSPVFTGLPKAPTQPTIDSTQNLATTAFVKAALAAGGASISVGTAPPPSPTVNALWWNSEVGQLLLYFDDGNTRQWVPASPAAAVSQIPPGSGQDFFGTVVPAGWYACDGSLKNRVTDAPLFAAIGITYGAGDGATTFALPDTRGRATVGVDPGGTAGRLTTAVCGVDGATLGAAGGSQNLHAHAHVTTDHLHQGANGGNSVAVINGGTNFGFTTNSGNYIGAANVGGPSDRTLNTNTVGGGASQNVPPVLVINKIIKR
jgi:microcystin-dependent protein